MAKKKASEKNWTKPTYMFPSLHDAIDNQVRDLIGSIPFHEKNTNRNSSNKYQTHVMARFECPNTSCSASWGSKKVAIVIRQYRGNAYNALVFNQRCRCCNTLGKMTLDEDSYIERVSYRLKRWAGMKMERPPHFKRKGPPHESSLCEGCKAGYCQGNNNFRDYH